LSKDNILKVARMSRTRDFALAALFAFALSSEAAAQFFGPPKPQSNPCESFVPLQQDAQQGMEALKSANERKAPREEFCQIFQRLSVSVGKISKFLETNKALCNVPPEAVQRAKTDHKQVLTFRKQACAAASAPNSPNLSDVLGSPVLPDSTNTKPDSSIFNTLTGNPLAR
jgi:hypothetical protein